MFNLDTWKSPLSLFVLLLVILLCGIPFLAIVYVELKTVEVLFTSFGAHCKQHLWIWLLARTLLVWFAPQPPPPIHDQEQRKAGWQRLLARAGVLAICIWLLVGNVLVANETVCQTEQPLLYETVDFLILFTLLGALVRIAVPFGLVLCSTVFYSLAVGCWLTSTEAASPDSIDSMKKVEYTSQRFGGGDVATSCCCCMEEFDSRKDIVCTPCCHYFHYQCLQGWLRVGHTCPLCYEDFDPPREQD